MSKVKMEGLDSFLSFGNGAKSNKIISWILKNFCT